MVGSMIENPYKMKVGSIMPWSTNTAPVGWLKCDGSAISRTTYKALFNVIGTSFGSGDGTTTFNIPNGRIAVANQIPVKGTGKTLGLYNGSVTAGLASSDYSGANLVPSSSCYNVNVLSTGRYSYTDSGKWGMTTTASQSGVIADISTQRIAIIKY